LIAIIFQAWLGKMVVDSNLTANTITIHMLMAIILLFILFSILAISNPNKKRVKISRNISILVLISIVLLLIQIITGTEVRKFIDIKMELLNYAEKERWIENISSSFSFHRSFSWAIIFVNSLIYYHARKLGLKLKIIHIVNTLIFFQISSGIIMYYFHFPFSSQPIHLLISTMIISIQFYFLLLYKTSKNAIKI